MKYIAVIPARGGSKGIKKKNITPLASKPLIAYTLEAARNSEVFQTIYVTTDDADIENVALHYGAQVIKRPPQLADDFSRTEDALIHALSEIKDKGELSECFILLQPTSPLRTGDHIKEAVAEFEAGEFSTLVSICALRHPAQKCLVATKDGVRPVTSWDDLSKPRQQLPTSFQVNGAIYICGAENFLSAPNFFRQPVGTYVMSEKESLDIDGMQDIEEAESFIRSKGNQAGSSEECQ